MSRKSWIAESVDALNAVESWTGRTHIHKHLFITQVLGQASVPFQFELHHFGPYSYEIDSVVAEMDAFGEVEKRYPKAGYGPRYSTTDLAASRLSSDDSEALSRVSRALRNFNSNDLELIATCLWVELREAEKSDPVIVDRVKEIKPKYSTSQIQLALKQSRDVAAQLAT